MINLEQKDSKLLVSYHDENGEIKVSRLELRDDQMYNWYETTEDDRYKSTVYRSQNNKAIKRGRSRRLNTFRKIEILQELSESVRKRIFAPVIPKKTFMDIEVYSPDTFPEETLALHPIVTKCWVQDNDVTLLGLIDLNDEQIKVIERRVNAYIATMKDKHLVRKYKLRYIKYNSERELLTDFIENHCKTMHSIFGWNFLKFDMRYINNRCKRFNINYAKMSPTGSTFTWNMSDKNNPEVKVPVELPQHRLILDYMQIFEKFDRSVKHKTNINLDTVGEDVLGLKKIEFSGTIAELYENDPMLFMEYAVVDPILVQLIDDKLHTHDTMLYLASVGQVNHFDGFHASAIANTMFFDYYKNERKQILVKGEINDEPYAGGYVMNPEKGIWDDILIWDYTSKFPSCMMAMNIGADTRIGRLKEEYINTYYKKNTKGILVRYDEIHPRESYIGCEWIDTKGNDQKITKDHIVSANGIIYTKEKYSSLHEVVYKLFNGRVIQKNVASEMDAMYQRVKETKNFEEYGARLLELGVDNNIIDIGDIEMILNSIQGKKNDAKNLSEALKIQLNSTYGVIGYIMFVLYNRDTADSVTAQSRSLIQYTIGKINDYFQPVAKVNFWDDIEAQKKMQLFGNFERAGDVYLTMKPKIVKYADTDSIMGSLKWFYNEFDWENLIESGAVDLEKIKKEVWEVGRLSLDNYKGNKKVYYKVCFMLAFNHYVMQPFFSKIFIEYTQLHNAFDVKQDGSPSFKMGMEQVLENILFTGKKYYVKNPLWTEGKTNMSGESIEVKGLAINKSSYPKYVRDNLNKVVTEIMIQGENVNYSSVVKIVRTIKDGFELAGLNNTSISYKLNKYDNYVMNDNQEVVLLSGTPQNIRASANYNFIRNQPQNKEYQSTYSALKNGTKIQVYHIIDKNMGVFAFPNGEYPPFAPDMDVDKQFDTVILSPLNIVFSALGLDKIDKNLIVFSPLL